MYQITNIKKHKLVHIQPLLDLNILSDNIWLAGGSLQTLVDPDAWVYDYDIFFKSLDYVQPLRNQLFTHGYECIFECPLGELFTYKKNDIKVQLISKFSYKDIPTMLASFDFHASMWGYDGNTLYTTREAISATKNKQLSFNKITYPVATLKRIFKYRDNKDYTISNDDLVALVININTMDLDEANLIFYVD